MTALYVAVVGLSAFLLFQVQPMIAKIILPRFGGGASIWLTCLVFFQVVLLLGYASSHWLLTRLGTRRHLIVQALFVLVSLAFLPLRTRDTGLDPSTLTPAVDILLLLAASVGLPYFVLSTTSPAIQHWIGVGPGARMRNPYILYAVSNAGSLLGLLSYPVLVEPNLANRVQLGSWSVAFGVYAVLLLACIALRWKTADPSPAPAPEVDRGDRIRWLVFSLIPSAALIAITHHLTVDLANLPFLWVLPLALYLIS
ncbi:MAG: hypothetical protein O6952_06120, partial [Planctomycetota bacterium]|nr:hypothetical protein [Planctomycetota bacterium]